MASSDATPVPIKNQAYRVTFPIFDADGDLVTGAANLDSERSLDGANFADCTNEAVEIGVASGMYYLDLTAAEMNTDTTAVIIKTTTVGAKTTPIVLYPAEDADIPVNVTAISGDTGAADNLETACDGGAYNVGGGAIVAASVTGNVGGNVVGSVASVVGAVGSVIGNVGGNVVGTVASVVGAVGSVIGNVGGSVASVVGAVGSVIGNVGGNVAGSVGSVAAGGIAAASFVANAVNANALATDAVNEIADGVLGRAVANVEATADPASLAALILATFESDIAGAIWTIYRTDHVTVFAIRAVTLDAAADPIVGVT